MDKNLFFDTVVVGTGAAGYAAACRIRRDGGKRVAMVTEKSTFGTSRNTGSDKQTYYKLGLGGDSPDSVRQMADSSSSSRRTSRAISPARWISFALSKVLSPASTL